jgi:hypothetical protein
MTSRVHCQVDGQFPTTGRVLPGLRRERIGRLPDGLWPDALVSLYSYAGRTDDERSGGHPDGRPRSLPGLPASIFVVGQLIATRQDPSPRLGLGRGARPRPDRSGANLRPPAADGGWDAGQDGRSPVGLIAVVGVGSWWSFGGPAAPGRRGGGPSVGVRSGQAGPAPRDVGVPTRIVLVTCPRASAPCHLAGAWRRPAVLGSSSQRNSGVRGRGSATRPRSSHRSWERPRLSSRRTPSKPRPGPEHGWTSGRARMPARPGLTAGAGDVPG